jgi:hypothetical protein
MDWILASHILQWGMFPVFLFTLIIIVVGGISFFIEAIDNEVDEWREGVKRLIKPALIVYGFFIILGAFVVFANLPDILVETNVARIKLRYTDIETVQKLEGGAKEIVEKLNKLIDAGIKEVDQ